MRKEKIIFCWMDEGERNFNEVDRQNFFDAMDGLRKGFPNDNEISKKLCEIIPDLTMIFIDKDRNRQKDVPFICYEINGKQKTLDIIRYHKIIWSLLDKYTS